MTPNRLRFVRAMTCAGLSTPSTLRGGEKMTEKPIKNFPVKWLVCKQRSPEAKVDRIQMRQATNHGERRPPIEVEEDYPRYVLRLNSASAHQELRGRTCMS